MIESVLREYAQLFNQQPKGIDVLAICDEATDTYAVVNVGWDGNERLNTTSVLVRIVNGKIWVEEDRTMVGFVARQAMISHFTATQCCFVYGVISGLKLGRKLDKFSFLV